MSETAENLDARDDDPLSLRDAALLLDRLETASPAAVTPVDSFKVYRIFERAAHLGTEDQKELSEFIQEHLLPRCCEVETADEEALGSRCRELLRDWIESLRESLLRQVRNVVLEDIEKRLSHNPNNATLYTLSAIGFRSRTTVRVLRKAMGGEGEMADCALRLLSGLRVEPTDKKWLVKELKARLKVRSNAELLQAAAILGGSEWITQLSTPDSPTDLFWRGFGRLAWLCDDAPGDGALQDQVWGAIKRLASASRDGWQILVLSGGILSRCHSVTAVMDFVDELPRIVEAGDIHLYRWCNQLQAIQSPAHVLGWRESAGSTVEACLRPVVGRPSGHEGQFKTIELRVKDDALQTILCSGQSSILDWANDAIAEEGEVFARHGIMEALAVLSFDALPATVLTILRTPLNIEPSSEDGGVLAHLAAARVAGCSQTYESMELLLDAQFTRQGHPYVSPANSGAALARHLLRRGDSRIFELLTNALRTRQHRGAISIASKAACVIAHEFPLPGDLIAELFALARDVEEPDYLQRDALASIAEVAAQGGKADALQFLREYAESAPNGDIKEWAISLLIYALPDDEFRRLDRAYWTGLVPELKHSDTKSAHQIATIYGQLAARNPEVYGLLCADGFREPTVCEAIIWGFRKTRRAVRELPDVMSSALAKNIKERESADYAHPRLIREMALAAPRRFLQEDWQLVWDHWMPDARKELADAALAAVQLVAGESSLMERALKVFESLRGDPIFAVRRSAARALSETNPRGLREWCRDVIASGSINARRIAAYAAGWLPLDSDATLDNELLRRFRDDDERSVREMATRARNEARKRKWSAELLRMIREPHADANGRVLRAYAASRALANVGDDSDIERLSRMLSDDDIPPNVYYWLTRTRRSLEDQWKKTTSKWPEPWLPWKGAIERVNGTLVNEIGEHPNVHFTLWRRTGFGADFSDWGGSIGDLPGSAAMRMFIANQSGITIKIPGRAEAKAFLSEMGEAGTLLSGTGPYPSVQDAP